MKVNSIRNILLAAAGGSLLLLASCKKDNLEKYMEANNYTKEKIDSTMDATKRDNSLMQSTVRQSTIDSMAFRNLFEGTRYAQNSDAVANFNEIAGRMRVDSMDTDNRFFVQDEIANNAYKENINPDIVEELQYINPEEDSDLSGEEHVAKIQYLADRAAYEKFFADHGLMKCDFIQKFDSVSNSIKPVQ